MNRIRKGDQVVVLTGRDRGKLGSVMTVLDADRVLVEGVNIRKKHVRPNPAQEQAGGIIEKETPIHQSNVALYDRVAKRAGKVGIKVLKDGRKVRYFKKSGEMLDAV